ncbi:dihydropteroate synthase [uncultured Anaerotruncus sp.]|uniref:dihydropteroate synthase n=1 Tax=uncultured Anaerotruncus sp. TaxID=905011 RepID=UPI00258C3835|nr:dihydropteroate synthase [uncultured Anaerotruncus sp.]
MILIGEKLNSSIPKTMEAFSAHDEAAVIGLIQAQADAGAEYLDVNTAICGGEELAAMLWVVALIREHSSCGIMIDTADPAVMAQAVQAAAGTPLILNSATLTDRFDEVTALAHSSGASVVGLPIDGEMPHTLEEKCEKLAALVEKLRKAGLPDERIYADVLIETLATDGASAKNAVGAVQFMAQNYPDVRTTCGLSNISFGLPRRSLINSAFLSAAMMAGLSSAILDPGSPAMQAALAAAKVVAGQDDYCMDYITHIRGGEL